MSDRDLISSDRLNAMWEKREWEAQERGESKQAG
jgi:hypothetical protein